MASPHVAGIAALIFSQGLHDPALIEGVIESTALDLGSPGRDNQFGFGRVQPRLALIGAAIKK
jgi:serine protease